MFVKESQGCKIAIISLTYFCRPIYGGVFLDCLRIHNMDTLSFMGILMMSERE